MSLTLALTLLLQVTPPDTFPYDLNNPYFIINLVSEDLKEISGLSPTDSAGIYLAIADEVGEIFFIDGNGGAILRKVFFRDKGDFEGVEMVGKCLYAVKSNGDIFEVGCWDSGGDMNIVEYKSPLKKTDDVEGLCYDAQRYALLLACKQNPDSAGLRRIFAFDLKTKKLSAEPVYTIDPQEVNRLVPLDNDDKNRQFISPSGIAIHPKTGDVYVISTSQKRLVVLDYKTGAIRYAMRLDKKMLPQPEGIAFDPDGNLNLSSEGKKGEGLVFKFRYKTPK